MVFELPVAAARRQEDRVGVVERRGIGGPAVEVDVDARALEGGRRVDAVLEEEDVALVLVAVFRVGVERTGDEDDLLGPVGRRRRDERQDQREREQSHFPSGYKELSTASRRFWTCF